MPRVQPDDSPAGRRKQQIGMGTYNKHVAFQNLSNSECSRAIGGSGRGWPPHLVSLDDEGVGGLLLRLVARRRNDVRAADGAGDELAEARLRHQREAELVQQGGCLHSPTIACTRAAKTQYKLRIATEYECCSRGQVRQDLPFNRT
jgi:hypothetical protein